jgi:hypothetical protein
LIERRGVGFLVLELPRAEDILDRAHVDAEVPVPVKSRMGIAVGGGADEPQAARPSVNMSVSLRMPRKPNSSAGQLATSGIRTRNPEMPATRSALDGRTRCADPVGEPLRYAPSS